MAFGRTCAVAAAIWLSDGQCQGAADGPVAEVQRARLTRACRRSDATDSVRFRMCRDWDFPAEPELSSTSSWNGSAIRCDGANPSRCAFAAATSWSDSRARDTADVGRNHVQSQAVRADARCGDHARLEL